MKKVLLAAIIAVSLAQPVMAGLVPVANVKLDSSCYEFSLIATAPVVAAFRRSPRSIASSNTSRYEGHGP